MRLADFVNPDLLFVNVEARDTRELLERLAGKVCALHTGLDETACLESLLERERKFSTGLECGIAVPHAMLPGVPRTICAVATMARPVDMHTLDDSPVRVVFLLLSPPDGVATHIRTLARIARFCSLPEFIERLIDAPDAEALHRVIIEEDERHV